MICDECKEYMNDSANICPHCWAIVRREEIHPSIFKFFFSAVIRFIALSFFLSVINVYDKKYYILGGVLCLIGMFFSYLLTPCKVKIEMTRDKK